MPMPPQGDGHAAVQHAPFMIGSSGYDGTVKLFDMVNKGLTQSNHQYFYDNISKFWQNHITVSDISRFGNFETEAFKDFFNNFSKENLIITKEPIIDSDNWLVIE